VKVSYHELALRLPFKSLGALLDSSTCDLQQVWQCVHNGLAMVWEGLAMFGSVLAMAGQFVGNVLAMVWASYLQYFTIF